MVHKQATETLNKFHELEAQFEQSTDTLLSNNNLITNNLTKQWYQKALQLKSVSDTTVANIESVKNHLIENASNVDQSYDWFDASEQQLVILKMDLFTFQHYVDSVFPGYVPYCDDLLDLEGQTMDGHMVTWEQRNFNYAPLAAGMTILTKYKSHVRTVQSTILYSLNRQLLIVDEPTSLKEWNVQIKKSEII